MMTDKHLTTTDTAEAERACQRLVLRYAALIDTGAASRVPELFADDAVWEGGARRWSGIDEIRRGFAGREAMPRISCHLVGPSLVTLTSPRKAQATTSYLLLRADRAALRGGPVPSEWELAGFYDDRFSLVGSSWLFSHRRSVVTFVSDRAG
jgi:hypothetical protein